MRCAQRHAPLRPAGGRAASRGGEEEEADLRTGTKHSPAPGGAGFLPKRSLLGGKKKIIPVEHQATGEEVMSRAWAAGFCPPSKQKRSHEALLTGFPNWKPVRAGSAACPGCTGIWGHNERCIPRSPSQDCSRLILDGDVSLRSTPRLQKDTELLPPPSPGRSLLPTELPASSSLPWQPGRPPPPFLPPVPAPPQSGFWQSRGCRSCKSNTPAPTGPPCVVEGGDKHRRIWDPGRWPGWSTARDQGDAGWEDPPPGRAGDHPLSDEQRERGWKP